MVKATNDTFDPKSFLPKVGEGKTNRSRRRSLARRATDDGNDSECRSRRSGFSAGRVLMPTCGLRLSCSPPCLAGQLRDPERVQGRARYH